ncbi:GvpL/GvpF family gas vesicle protein [Actinopolymorpha pittospori]
MTGETSDLIVGRPTSDEVAALVAEADAQARSLVRDELVDEFAERYRKMVAERLAAEGEGERGIRPGGEGLRAESSNTTASALPSTTPSPTPPSSSTPSSTTPSAERPSTAVPEPRPSDNAAHTETAWYVYAVVRASDWERADAKAPVGLEGRPIEVVPADDLAVATAEVPVAGFRTSGDEPDLSADGWLREAVQAHERVVERLCAAGTTLPFRFGALYPSRGDARTIVVTHARELRAELDRLDAAAEWGVKGRVTEPEPEREREETRPGEAGGGTSWMLRRREEAAAREEARELNARMAKALDDSLSLHARESFVRAASRPEDPAGLVFDAVYLVPHAAEDDFDAALQAVAERYAGAGLRLEVSGPWPPYHFVQLPEQPGAVADPAARDHETVRPATSSARSGEVREGARS